MRYLVASLLCVFTLSLTSCTATITAHSFEMVPNTPVGTDGKFFYVKYGVVGTSSTYYNRLGGGDVRNGLVADAKSNLRNQHLLGPNQSYSNMSVDVLETKAGINTSQGFSVNEMTITVVVEADIIEYGTPPENYEPIVQSAKSLPIDVSSSVISDSKELNDNSIYSDLKYQLGEFVVYDNSGSPCEVEIIGYNFLNELYRIKYFSESGKVKRKYVTISLLSQPIKTD